MWSNLYTSICGKIPTTFNERYCWVYSLFRCSLFTVWCETWWEWVRQWCVNQHWSNFVWVSRTALPTNTHTSNIQMSITRSTLACLSGYVSPILGADRTGLISTKTGKVVSDDDRVSRLSFGLIIFRGFRSTRGQSFCFPVDFTDHYESDDATIQLYRRW